MAAVKHLRASRGCECSRPRHRRTEVPDTRRFGGRPSATRSPLAFLTPDTPKVCQRSEIVTLGLLDVVTHEPRRGARIKSYFTAALIAMVPTHSRPSVCHSSPPPVTATFHFVEIVDDLNAGQFAGLFPFIKLAIAFLIYVAANMMRHLPGRIRQSDRFAENY
jgi:hypothetical protein